jgi:tetratricopeptide (TPR) repeat protein
MSLNYKKSKEKMLTNLDNDCQQFFIKKGYILESAYCYLLNDNLNEAKRNFSLIKDQDIRASWALFMISMIEGNIKEYPTYFQLRNFLEIDLNILIHYFKGEYADNILRYADFMFTINPEVYKFIGRCLYNNNLEMHALMFLEKAKSYFWHDPELHYLLAYIYYNRNDKENARKALEICLEVLPKYFPAVDMLSKID